MRMMRRGRLDNRAIIFIIIAGIFALLSFAMDQAAVQTEDRLRDENVQYQSNLFNLAMNKDAHLTLNNLTHTMATKSRTLSFSTNFLSYLLQGTLDPNYMKKSFNIFDDEVDNKKYIENVRWIYQNYFLEHYSDHLEEFKFALQMFNSINLDEKKYGQQIKKFKSIFNIDFDYHNNLINSFRPLELKGLNSQEEIYKSYRELSNLNIAYEDGIYPIKSIGSAVISDWQKYGLAVMDNQSKVLRLKSYKNYFILFSIFFQILGLLFLLLLFRNILLKIKK